MNTISNGKIYIVTFSIIISIMLGCGDSEILKQREIKKQQTLLLISDLTSVFDSNYGPEKIISEINRLLSKYPEADSKLKSAFAEYSQYMDEARKYPSWWSQAGEGIVELAVNSRFGVPGLVKHFYNAYQDDKEWSSKGKELRERQKEVFLKIEELPNYLKKEYGI